jgi:3-hydroxyisobutyrate dehydrogenase|tara:strand:+ start:1437 stop:2315 length:879 start_codon:yes stop_codon:yes gene_type:complete
MKNIGFIGLGNMGSKMALHLINDGYHVFGYDLNENLIDQLSNQGVIKIKSLSDFAQNIDVIITMLPDGHIVQKVINEILSETKNNPIFIDCSTIDVNNAIALNNFCLTKNIKFLDAPVSGGTKGAENGTLTFMVGGEEAIFTLVSPLLDLMGSKSVYCGNSGSGQAAKLCNNMLLATTMIGVSESFNMAKNLNLDLGILFDVISTATGSCWAVNNYCPIPNVGPLTPADNDFLPGFSAKLMSKDLKLAITAAKESNSSVNFGKMAEQLFTKMAQGTNGNKDFSAIINELNVN